MKVPYSYLEEQFRDPSELLKGVERIVKEGDFTLGRRVLEFEQEFAKFAEVKYAVGVGSGTAALQLGLEATGVTNGEVITSPNTFYATVNAIVAAGAKPVFVDVGDDYNINPDLIEEAITPRTKAIMPVHLTGRPADMIPIMEIAHKHDLVVVEDAAQAIDARINGTHVGNFGVAGGFSFHPLKNLNVWGDAGMAVTNDKEVYENLLMLRNQGMSDRDAWAVYGYNYRIDPLQAYVGRNLIGQTRQLTDKRIENAMFYDSVLKDIDGIIVPQRKKGVKEVFHTYVIQVRGGRDELYKHLQKEGIDAKIHYPVPLHLQPAAKDLGYNKGDFPVTEKQTERILTLPVHSYLTDEQREYVAKNIKRYYE